MYVNKQEREKEQSRHKYMRNGCSYISETLD